MRTYQGQVMKVVDGDTRDILVDLGFKHYVLQRFRFARVDAYETRTEKGKEAKRFCQLYEGKNAIIQSQKTGKYGRWLAEIYIDGVNINNLLIEKGLAVYYK